MKRRRHCATCGIGEGNGSRIPVRDYHLRPARGQAGTSGTSIAGRLPLCDRCLVEYARGAVGVAVHERPTAGSPLRGITSAFSDAMDVLAEGLQETG